MSPDVAVKQIATRLAELGSTFEADLWLVCDFLGIRHGQGPPSWLGPRARNVRLLDIVRHMIRQRGATASVIIIEDLHWLDQASEEFVATLVDAVNSTKTVLIVNFRPAYFAPWMRGPLYQQIELAELSPTDTDDLVNELLGPGDELSRRPAARRGAQRRQSVLCRGADPFPGRASGHRRRAGRLPARYLRRLGRAAADRAGRDRRADRSAGAR